MNKYIFLIIIAFSFSNIFGTEKHHKHGSHGNPASLGAYIKMLDDPSRDIWQRPLEVFKAIGLKEGETLCDIGAGPGYMSFKAAKIVGENGHVFSTDVEVEMTKTLKENIEKNKIRNISPILGLYDNPLLPPVSCDYILIVNTYHHFSDRITYIKNLKRYLSPKGKVVNIDFHKKELPIGPKIERKISQEDFRKEAKLAGYTDIKEHTFLEYQYFFELK